MKQLVNNAILAGALFGAALLFWIIAGPVHAAGIFGELKCEPPEPLGTARFSRCTSSRDMEDIILWIKGTPKPEPEPARWEYAAVRHKMTATPHKQFFRDTGLPYWTDPGGDLILIDSEGKTKTVFDCDSKCSALEPDISPDRERLVFVVSYLDPTRPVTPSVQHSHSDIYEYKLPDGPLRKVITGGRNYDPAFARNNMLRYTSDWLGIHAPHQFDLPTPNTHGSSYPYPGQRVRTALIIDDKYVPQDEDIWPHAPFVMGLEVLHDGQICASSLWAFNNRKYGTPPNGWIPECSDGNGENSRPIANAHGTPLWKKRALYEDIAGPFNPPQDQIRSIRGIVEIAIDTLAWTDYYRTNHNGGMGIVWAQELLRGPEGIASGPEGLSRCTDWKLRQHEKHSSYQIDGSCQFVNPTLRPIVPMALSADGIGGQDKQGRPFGSVGDPFALPDDPLTPAREFGIVWSPGSCFVNKTAAEIEAGACHLQLYKVKVAMVTNPYDPSQMEPIYSENGHHIRNPVWIGGTYKDLFGIDQPALPPPPSKECSLKVRNARSGEIHKLDWQTNYKPHWDATFQGNAVDGWQARIDKFCTREIIPFKGFPAQYALETKPKVCTDIEDDGSVFHPVPCGVSYLMHGEDKDGEPVATDNRPHSGGGACFGCHDGHGIAMWNYLAAKYGPPHKAFESTDAYKAMRSNNNEN